MVLGFFSAITLFYTNRTSVELIHLLPFALLLCNITRASSFAEMVLKSHTVSEVRANISQSMAMLGPGITLDTITEVLFIGMGSLSGIPQLAHICYYSCIAVFINYVVLLSVFPAFLSLVLEVYSIEISGDKMFGIPKHNPLMFRLKIMTLMGLAATHLLAYVITGRYQLTAHNSTAGERLADEVHKQSDINWLTHQTVTVAVAFLLFFRCVLFGKVGKNSTDSSESLQDVPDTAVGAKPVEPAVNSSMVRSKMANGILNGSVSGIKCNMGTGVIASHASVEDLLTNRKEYLRASTDSGISQGDTSSSEESESGSGTRSTAECAALLKTPNGAEELTDEEVIRLVKYKRIPAYKLENTLGNPERGVSIRRRIVSKKLPSSDALDELPFTNYDYSKVMGACCENVVGYMPIPVGVAGPLLLDGKKFEVPLATTEGCLVASTNRGCRALAAEGGIRSYLLGNGMTRGPVLRCLSAGKASEIKLWIENQDNYKLIEETFNSTSRFGRLQSIQCAVAGRLIFMRFRATTGDAMGMNMISKGVEKSLKYLKEEHFPEMEVLSLSGNYCVDKKPSALNWIEGRGKSVVCEAIVPGKLVQEVLKTEVHALVELNISKNLIGSTMAGSIGGFNAHAANLVTALYIATGQDPAQNVGSSNCITLMEASGPSGEDLYISCTMPSIEIGTVGGGTVLPAQSACLKMLAVYGPNPDTPGENANQLARIVCATVMAGELSLLSALAAGHLVKSHLTHNRSKLNLYSLSSRHSSLTTVNENDTVFEQQKESPHAECASKPLFTL